MQCKHTTHSTAVSMPAGIFCLRPREKQTYHYSGDTLVSRVHAAVGGCTEHASGSRDGVNDSADREAVLVNGSSVVIQGLANLQSKHEAQALATSAAQGSATPRQN